MEEKPLKREEVLKMIEKHDGPEGLLLPGSNLKGIDLSLVDLHGIVAVQVKLQNSNLYGANLRRPKLVQAEVGKAYLSFAKLQGADLRLSNLERAWLYGVEISRETRSEDVNWGTDYVMGEEGGISRVVWGIDRCESHERFGRAADVYRELKRWHTGAGLSDLLAL